MRDSHYNILYLALLWFAVLSIGCGTTRELSLTDVNQRFASFENSDFNPLKDEKTEILVTNIPKYDTFLEQSKNIIISLQLGENILESAEEKKQDNEDISEEIEAANSLAEELPSLIAELPSLIISGDDIIKNIESDLTGTNSAMIPKLGLELTSTLAKLTEYSAKAPKILTEIQSISSHDEKSNAVAINKRDLDNSFPEATASSETEELEPDLITDLTKEEEIQEPDKEEKEKFTKREVNLPPTSTREIASAEYDRKLKEGLIRVFQAESTKNVKKLSNLTLRYSIPRVRAAAALALGRIRQGRWTLEKSIETDGFVVRTAAYKSLAEIGEKRSLPYFIAGIQSEDHEIQAASFLGLGKTKDPAGRELILGKGLTSDKMNVIIESLKGIAYFRIPSDLDIISKYLGVEEKDLQIAAIESLTIHNTPESMVILENALVDYPNLTMEILDSVAESKELAATFFLVRASQLYEDEKVLDRVGHLLLKRKAYGRYGMVMVKEDRIRKQGNERADATGIVRLSEVGRVNSSSKKRYIAKVGEELQEDVYHNMTFENRVYGSKERYARGWIFGKKIQLITIKKPSNRNPAFLENKEAGKFQNLYDPK